MSISLLDNFSLGAKKPNFARDLFNTVAEMKAFSPNYLPDVFECNVVEDGQRYRYHVNNTEDPVTGKWRVVGVSQDIDLSGYYNKDEVNALLDNKVNVEIGKQLSTEDFTTEDKVKLDSLENFDPTALDQRITANEEAITILNSESTVPGSVSAKATQAFEDSKEYTDQQVQNAIKQTAISCDAKPVLTGTDITYVKGGVSHTIPSDNKTRFFYTVDGVNYSTIWIESTEFTDTLAAVNFSDLVSYDEDVVSDYTPDLADKSKVPDIAALDSLYELVSTDLDSKISSDEILASVSESSDSPVASSGIYTALTEKVSINQGVDAAGKILQVNEEGNLALVDVAATGGDASGIFYENPNLVGVTNVKAGLDSLVAKLYYVAPKVVSFTSNPSVREYEIGQTVSSVTFTWSYNKDITSQTLTDCDVSDVSVRTAVYDTPFGVNKTFTLTASDGQESASSSISFSFKNKVYYGGAPEPISVDSAFVLGLPSSKFATTLKGTYNFNIPAGSYGYIAYPSSFGTLSSWYIGGFETTVENVGSFAFTNASGATVTYTVCRTGRSGLGNISAEVK